MLAAISGWQRTPEHAERSKGDPVAEHTYRGAAPYACDRCRGRLQVFVRPTASYPVDDDWAIVCLSCRSVETLDAFEREVQGGLRSWSIPGRDLVVATRRPSGRSRRKASPSSSRRRPASRSVQRQRTASRQSGAAERPTFVEDLVLRRPEKVEPVDVCSSCGRPISTTGLCGCS